ncbi:hypothetical protein ACHAC9_23750 [Massilia sp. CMS3.1]|uniref:hypothetical protein n=1 Tax=Massilia sp. CMS3.1 TaxID=3373083 RepID=UPI003EE63571
MRLKLHSSAYRFSSPTVLKGDAPLLGATVQEWDKAIVGNMDETLAQVKLRVMGTGAKHDATKATMFAPASFAGNRLADSE